MRPLEGFAIAMDQFKAEAMNALLDVYHEPEECARQVSYALDKIKAIGGNNIATFIACAQIVVTLTRERVLRDAERNDTPET
jgi:hypothetical protein